jgi:hypothetical protein
VTVAPVIGASTCTACDSVRAATRARQNTLAAFAREHLWKDKVEAGYRCGDPFDKPVATAVPTYDAAIRRPLVQTVQAHVAAES